MLTFSISKSISLMAIVAASILATGCAQIQSKLPGNSQASSPAAAAEPAKPAPVNLCADATDPAPAKKGAKASAISYDEVTKILGQKGGDKKIKRDLVGKTVQVCVTKYEDIYRAGPNMFEVKPDDLTYFVCKSAAPTFKGGQITAKITNYIFQEEMNQVLISIDRCVATNVAALNPPAAAPAAQTVSASPKVSTSSPAPAAAGGKAKPGMDAQGNVVDSSKVEAGSGRTVKGINDYEGEITGNPVRGSKFDQLQIGMSLKQVTDIVGEPTDSGAYVTGKAWIPFYYGSDRTRFEMTYKAKGRLIFAGGSIMGGTTGGNLIWVINNPNESGYR